MQKICSFDLNQACMLSDEQLEIVGQAISDAYFEGKRAFNNNFYTVVADISKKLMNTNMANSIHCPRRCSGAIIQDIH